MYLIVSEQNTVLCVKINYFIRQHVGLEILCLCTTSHDSETCRSYLAMWAQSQYHHHHPPYHTALNSAEAMPRLPLLAEISFNRVKVPGNLKKQSQVWQQLLCGP